MNEMKIVSYSFSSSVIEYNTNEKLLRAWSGARFYKNQQIDTCISISDAGRLKIVKQLLN